MIGKRAPCSSAHSRTAASNRPARLTWPGPLRGLDKALFTKLAAGDWIARHQNLAIIGTTGLGKSLLACALSHKACRDDRSVLYHRVPRLSDALALARGDGQHARMLKTLSRVDLLVGVHQGVCASGLRQRKSCVNAGADRTRLDQWPHLPDQLAGDTSLVLEDGKVTALAVTSAKRWDQLFAEAKRRGVKKLLVNHPTYLIGCTDEDIRGLVALGATMEHSICMFVEGKSLKFDGATLEHLIEVAGVDQTILSSDLGLVGSPRPSTAIAPSSARSSISRYRRATFGR